MITASALVSAFPGIRAIRDERLHGLVFELWRTVGERNPTWTDLEDIPLFPTLPIATYGNLASHVRAMARMTATLVPVYADAWGIALDLDAYLTSVYVHDAAKVIEFTRRGGAVVATPGFNHALEAGSIVRELGGPENIAHMVECHSFAGPLVVPRTRDAQLFLFLDPLCLPVFPEQGPSAVARHLAANGWSDPRTKEGYRSP